MICCCTGHRPQGFPWAYNVDKQKHKNYKKELLSIIEYLIKEKDVSEFIWEWHSVRIQTLPNAY